MKVIVSGKVTQYEIYMWAVYMGKVKLKAPNVQSRNNLIEEVLKSNCKSIYLYLITHYWWNGDTFQIWKPEPYEAVEMAEAEKMMEDLPEDFDPHEFLDGAGGA